MFHDSSKRILRQLAIKNILPSVTTQPPFSATKAISLAISERKRSTDNIDSRWRPQSECLCFHLLILSHKPLTVIGFLMLKKVPSISTAINLMLINYSHRRLRFGIGFGDGFRDNSREITSASTTSIALRNP